MSAIGLLDSIAAVSRISVTDDLAGDVAGPVVPVAQYRCALSHGSILAADEGSGERQRGRSKMFFEPGVNIKDRDVIDIKAGPDTGTRWIIAGIPARHGNSHTQVEVEPFDGPRRTHK